MKIVAKVATAFGGLATNAPSVRNPTRVHQPVIVVEASDRRAAFVSTVDLFTSA
jgi:hypothetical protein